MVRSRSAVRFRALALVLLFMLFMRRWQSGQLHQTVNLTPSGYAGSNPARRTRAEMLIFVWALQTLLYMIFLSQNND